MKDLFKKIKENEKRLEEIAGQIENIKTLPFYSIYGNPQEREKDLQSCYEARKTCLDLKQIYLENLQLEINKEMNYLSQMQKENTLISA